MENCVLRPHVNMELPPRVSTKAAVSGDLVTWVYLPDGQLKSGWPITGATRFTQSYVARGEWMDSVKGGDFNVFKPCDHYVVGCTIFNDIERKRTFKDTSSGEYGWVIYKNALGDQWPSQLGELDMPVGTGAYAIPMLYRLVGGRRIVETLADVGRLREDSLRILLPQIRPQLSLLNSLLELKDFKRSARFLQTYKLDSAGELLRRAKKFFTPRRGDKRTVRRYLRASADGYLQAQFNILPLLSDIVGITTAIKNVRKEVQNLLDRERLPQLRHYVTGLGSQYSDTYVNVIQEPLEAAQATLDGVTNYSRDVKYVDASFHATIRYSYTLSGWERQNALLGGFLDSLGVNFNPAIIWNAIPWTFVIDWLANVSRFLDQSKFRWLEPVCTIDDYCCSVHVHRYIECFQEFNMGGTVQNGTPVIASRIGERAYKRFVGIPDFYNSVRLSGLSQKEFSLSAALVASRL